MDNISILKNNGVNVDAALEFLGDMDMYNETLSDFLDGLTNRVKSLNDFRINGDMENYSISVHSLKSDSKYLGFNDLSELALSHELESKNGNIDFVNENFESLMKELKRVVEVARTYVSTLTNTNEVVEISDESKDQILIVDDSDVVRNFISKVFNNTFDCILAGDGNEAINALNSENRIKAVLLDLNMPGVNGFEVLDYLKTNDLFRKYPVSIITGADDKETITKAFQYQIIDMLQKPFNERDVKRIIERTINYGIR